MNRSTTSEEATLELDWLESEVDSTTIPQYTSQPQHLLLQERDDGDEHINVNDDSIQQPHLPISLHLQQQRKLATTLYLITTSLLFADQNLLSPNLSTIAAEFNFDEMERDKKLGGDIAIAFFMVGVPASFIVGCLADVMNRRSLLFLWVILIGEGACMATYWVQTYTQLYWCRAMTGMSVGGALPLIYSVLGDYYEPSERGWVSGAVSMGCGIGISIGQGLAGVLGPRYGWRVPFLVVSIPAMICALGVWLLVGEVERGGGEKKSMLTSAKEKDVGRRICDEDERVLEMNTLQAIVQGAPGCIPWGIINTFLNDYLSSDRGMTVEGATLMILVFGLGNFVGVSLGGIGASYLYSIYGPRYPSLLSGGSAIAGCFPMWALLNYDYNNTNDSNSYESDENTNDGDMTTNNSPLFVLGAITFLAGAASGITGPIVKSTLQNVTLPQMRGQAFALLNTFDDFGRGLGPAFVAWMIEQMGGRRKAFNVGVGGWLFCGLFNGMLFFTVESDEEKVRMGVEGLMSNGDGEVVANGSNSLSNENERQSGSTLELAQLN
ncbi:transporter [Thalassiosira pseudonana CCMP1335]